MLSGSRPVAATLCRGEPILRDTASQTVPDLPAPVVNVLEEVVRAARAALGEDLHSIVLFGSAAEAQPRATSDVNLITASRWRRPTPPSVCRPCSCSATRSRLTRGVLAHWLHPAPVY
jgi:hypothetical protein